MKHALKISIKFIGFISLCVAFLFIWSNLRISKAIEDGAFDKPVFCIDAFHLKSIKNDRPSQNIVDIIVTKQIMMKVRKTNWNNLYWHSNRLLNGYTLKIFYSKHERRTLYALVIDQAKRCSHMRNK